MKYFFTLVMALCAMTAAQAQKSWSGNPIDKGWYADPEAVVFGHEYWIILLIRRLTTSRRSWMRSPRAT